MLLVAPNGVKVEACEAGAGRMLACGFRRAAGKKAEEEKAAPKRAPKTKE